MNQPFFPMDPISDTAGDPNNPSCRKDTRTHLTMEACRGEPPLARSAGLQEVSRATCGSSLRALLHGPFGNFPGWMILRLCLSLVVIGGWWAPAQEEMPRNETRFTMGRIRYTTPDFGGGRFRNFQPPWGHDWPRSEQHLMKIMAELTKLDVNPAGHIISFDNKDVFKYPIAYLCEVGFFDLTDEEARNMSEYLLRGGFLIVDDFRGERALENFRYQMRRVFPDCALEELPRTHPIWTCFYDISNVFPPVPSIYSRSFIPQYLGMSDDKGRLMMVVDYNNDLSEYWEWSDNPFMPIDETNEAFKYGVNYLMYALTH